MSFLSNHRFVLDSNSLKIFSEQEVGCLRQHHSGPGVRLRVGGQDQHRRRGPYDDQDQVKTCPFLFGSTITWIVEMV